MSTSVAVPCSLREALRDGKRVLAAVSDEAPLEAELLLMHALSVSRAGLYRSLQDSVTSAALDEYRCLLNRRLDDEPTPYIRKRKEFYGLEFEVTPAAIIPRPETETLVELAVAFVHHRFGQSPVTIVDVGTGSGAIAVSLAKALPQAAIAAIDVSPEALALARRNAERHGVESRLQFPEGDLLKPIAEPVDIIVANLPYVNTSDWERLPPEIRDHEPRQGLDGGPDGLDLIGRLLEQAPAYLKNEGALFAEIGYDQAEAALTHARQRFPGAGASIEQDLAGRDRVLCVYA